MQVLPQALHALADYNQFILYKLIPNAGGFQKIPVNPRTREPFPKGSDWQKKPEYMADFATASANCITGYGVGFLFTPSDPFFFLDIDDCLIDGKWSPLALELCGAFNGAAVEISASGSGLHIFGKYNRLPPHSNKNTALGLELYTEWRFVALTGTGIIGDVASTFDLTTVAGKYFKPHADASGALWSNEPVEQWNGPKDDATLIERMLSSKSAASVFGGKSNFQALWGADEDVLSRLYSDTDRPFDASQADAALAQHLAFWTGNNCERMLGLMWLSGLVRDKWHRDDYLQRTILRACGLQKEFYCEVDLSVVEKFGATRIDAASESQRVYAESIRARAVSAADDTTAQLLCSVPTSAKMWIDNADKTPQEIAKMLTPAAEKQILKAERVEGYQYLSADLQIERFDGCVYIQDLHRIFTPRGSLMKTEQFNAMFGGYVFQLDGSGDKVTRKAWEAFTESQCVRFPKADTSVFKPKAAPSELINQDGFLAVNTYVPVETPRLPGDVSPFLNHVEKLLPDANDRAILIAYMAAVVQHKGVKFQWCPLIQGTQGNGKTLFTRCVAFAIGARYTHMPKASDLTNKFNGWLLNKIFIGVEDIYVSESRREILDELKPMITGERQEIQLKGADQFTTDICANFILNSNHKDAVRKTEDDRRFAVFYTAQQSAEDIVRDGMGGAYFERLYAWLNTGGYAMVNEYLSTYSIPDALNPAIGSHRAPNTSSTAEAIQMGLGSVEQEILEAIEEQRLGFAKGWASSVALERILRDMRAERSIPRCKRAELMRSLGYVRHPHLPNGRATTVCGIDDNKKPILYVKKGHISTVNEIDPAKVVKLYLDAQATVMGSVGTAEEVFK